MASHSSEHSEAGGVKLAYKLRVGERAICCFMYAPFLSTRGAYICAGADAISWSTELSPCSCYCPFLTGTTDSASESYTEV